MSQYVAWLSSFNPSNAKLNPICHLLALLGAHHILHISRIRVNDTSSFFFVASQKLLLKLSRALPYVPAADASLLFGDADDITSDEDEQAAPAVEESPASRHDSGDEKDSDGERSRDRDDEDDNRQSLPVIEDVSSC
jgi:hypothetical protein